MISQEQIAHDLALVYLVNRYGAEVTGDFDVSTSPFGDDKEVSGTGSVETERLPDIDQQTTKRVATGERGRFLFWEYYKTADVETGEYEIDPVLRSIMNDYRKAYTRFLRLLALDESARPGGTDAALVDIDDGSASP